MATNDSRHNFKLPRWSTDVDGVASGNETEPPSQQKDTGWVPGVDSINGRWWNWLHQHASYWMSWAENMWSRRWTEPHVMRSAKGTAGGEVTDGVGLSVDVTSVRVCIDGAMYQVPAATNLALAAADPTDPRFDLVVAQLDAGVPEYAVVTGTPDASPVEPDPGAGQVPIYRVRVNAAAVAPGTKADRREYGALELDRLEASQKLDAGDDGRTLKVRDNAGTSPAVTLFEDVDGLPSVQVLNASAVPELAWLVGAGLNLENLTGDLTIPGEAVVFPTPIVRKFDIPAAGFQNADTSTANLEGVIAAGVAQWNGAPTNDVIIAAVRVPNGATITAARLYITRDADDVGIRVRLLKSPKGTGVLTEVGNNATPIGSGATGAITLAITGLSEAVDQDDVYILVALWLGGAPSGTAQVFSGEVEYEVTRPFDSL